MAATGGAVVGTVPSYFELDSGIAWHATKSLEVSLHGAEPVTTPGTPNTAFRRPRREQIAAQCVWKDHMGY